MSTIKQIPTNWRDKWLPAEFRGARFFVENDAQAGGRRVALHEYPKRSIPYAEDMGRAARRFSVQGYLIGHLPGRTVGSRPDATRNISYFDLKNDLIDALEADGPGVLSCK